MTRAALKIFVATAFAFVHADTLAQTEPTAASYPQKPIRILQPAPPGGASDVMVRAVAQKLGTLGQPAVVDNRPGAHGIIANELAARARPDGYTLLYGTVGTIAINTGLYPKAPYRMPGDFSPLTQFVDQPNVVVVNASVPVESLADLVQLARSKPGQVSGGDLALVEEAAQRITRERHAFRADQFHLASSSRAHYLHTAPEILKQAGGKIDAFCDYLGTGSSFGGCAAAFKERDPAIQCYIVEPAEAAVLAGKPVTNPNHRIQGGGYAMEALTLIDGDHIDGYLQVTDEEAMQYARRLANEEAIFAGFSSGANVAAAIQLLGTTHQGKTVAVLLPDSGLKYLSTDLWL